MNREKKKSESELIHEVWNLNPIHKLLQLRREGFNRCPEWLQKSIIISYGILSISLAGILSYTNLADYKTKHPDASLILPAGPSVCGITSDYLDFNNLTNNNP